MFTLSEVDPTQTNERKANCRTCGCVLPAGRGIGYTTLRGSLRYYCPGCLVAKLTRSHLRLETHAALQPVWNWCYANVTRGMERITYDKIESLIMAADAYMLEIAEALVDTIEDLQLNDHVEVIAYVRRLIRSTIESVPADVVQTVDIGWMNLEI